MDPERGASLSDREKSDLARTSSFQLKAIISMKELLELIARSLVDNPDDVDVTRAGDDEEIVYELRVAAEDLGKVIGKQGRTARAIRTLVATAAKKLDQRVVFEIVE